MYVRARGGIRGCEGGVSAHNGSVLEHLARYTRTGGTKCVGAGWEVNEGAQDGNGDGSGDGDGDGGGDP